jgi:octaheme c-type cytochrome (tetrathionate reductase family)
MQCIVELFLFWDWISPLLSFNTKGSASTMNNKLSLSGLIVLMILSLMLFGQGCPSLLPPLDGDNGNNGSDVDDGDDITDENRHQLIFTEVIPEGIQSTSDCMFCHNDEAQQVLESGHYEWQGLSENIQGFEDGIHGKTDLINNFCIAVPSNEGRCTQCHAGIGWSDKTFDFSDAQNVDCLVCHDQSGEYQKSKTKAGAPAEGVDLQAAATDVGKPSRTNCGACHFYAGGGDNVKHGDLPSTLSEPSFDLDVHMAGEGLDFTCQQCHLVDDHDFQGMALHSLDEGSVSCTRCHGEEDVHERAELNLHLDSVACESCHIPAIARSVPTKVAWYWDEAGQDVEDISEQHGRPTFNKKKGRFRWEMNVRPELRWFNGKWERKIVGVNDNYSETPVVLAEPVGSIDDMDAKLYPFKKMLGNQPADPINEIMLVPHLFGSAAGPNPFWKTFEWGPALEEGAAYAGQEYSGEYTFVDTVMYLKVSHTVAPKEQALDCTDCHDGGINFTALGYAEDPWQSDR